MSARFFSLAACRIQFTTSSHIAMAKNPPLGNTITVQVWKPAGNRSTPNSVPLPRISRTVPRLSRARVKPAPMPRLLTIVVCRRCLDA